MNKKLHILFLSSWYPSRVFPTNGDFVQRHAEAVSLKNDVTVIHVVTDKKISTVEAITTTINSVKTTIIYIPKKKSIVKFYTIFKAYLSEINKIKTFDLIHLNVIYPKGIIALYLKLFKKIPYIITEHWTGYQFPLNKSIGFFKKIITKLIVKNATFICPVSKQLQKNMELFGLKGTYIPVANVVNTNLFFPVKKTHKTFTLSHVSSFNNEQKNITGILNVIKKLSVKRGDFIFKIAGNGNEDYLKKYIEELQIPSKNIEIINTKTQKEIVQILQKSSLYISFSNYETFGIVMTEAIATGTPVISTNTGILTELDASDFSSIIPINNEHLLLKTIIDYMSDNKNYDVQKMHSLINQNYSKTVICDRFTDVYFKTLEKNIS